MSARHESPGIPQMRSGEERSRRLRELETEGVDLSLLAEQLRLSPTARVESVLRLKALCVALAEAGTRVEHTQSERDDA